MENQENMRTLDFGKLDEESFRVVEQNVERARNGEPVTMGPTSEWNNHYYDGAVDGLLAAGVTFVGLGLASIVWPYIEAAGVRFVNWLRNRK